MKLKKMLFSFLMGTFLYILLRLVGIFPTELFDNNIYNM